MEENTFRLLDAVREMSELCSNDNRTDVFHEAMKVLEIDVLSIGENTTESKVLVEEPSTSGPPIKTPALIKAKGPVKFGTVQVFYFPRQQGYSCVPSAGGCTLGMEARHIALKTWTVAEHAAELRRGTFSEENNLSEGIGADLNGEAKGVLKPLPPRQRRALLKAAGIRTIDATETAECRKIRNSREACGCTCRDFCDPETCCCFQSGIECQTDSNMFPCGCSKDACGNTIGRVEFNPTDVRTRNVHTLKRLEMEK